ncbi:hypothetical protein BIV23_37160 [Streptomyces monashensis]|uniref:Uncharacterized protein n=1 Tax=Streptomyces monashensis TaxID=1678012 RepID=A0A1S2PJ60_9ACTN|nr:hypothetical protein BIV23_37160 [Streptomyces monashensis]
MWLDAELVCDETFRRGRRPLMRGFGAPQQLGDLALDQISERKSERGMACLVERCSADGVLACTG